MTPRTENPNCWIERGLIKSAAFRKLTGAAPRVLLIFFTKRQMRLEGKPGHKGWVQANNGELIFSYGEALDPYKLSAPRFKRALSELVEYGFLDIANPSAQLQKQCTRFALSDRWRRYGEADFQPASMPKGRRWALRT